MPAGPGFSGLSFSHRFLESVSTVSAWHEQVAPGSEGVCVHIRKEVCVHYNHV